MSIKWTGTTHTTHTLQCDAYFCFPDAYWTQDLEFADGLPMESISSMSLADEYGDYDFGDGEGQEDKTREHILVNGYQGILDG